MAFKSYNFGLDRAYGLHDQYSRTIDPETGERLRDQSELERYNRTPVGAYAVKY